MCVCVCVLPILNRYYNREAVVISALQVEKYPVTMPGPFVTPPSERHLFHHQNNNNLPLSYLHTPPPHPHPPPPPTLGHHHSVMMTPSQRFLQSATGSGSSVVPLFTTIQGCSRNTSPLPRICYNNESFSLTNDQLLINNNNNLNPSIHSGVGGHPGSTSIMHFGEHLYPVPTRSHSSPKMKLK